MNYGIVMQIVEDIRVLEVAGHTFVPAASAVLADSGADVIEVEHADLADAMRGLPKPDVLDRFGDVHVLLEHLKRGKRSIGIDLTKFEALEVLYAIAKTADVFLTSKLPGPLERLKFDSASRRRRSSGQWTATYLDQQIGLPLPVSAGGD